MWRNFKRVLTGSPLPSYLLLHERLPFLLALAVLASDPLSSVAYGPEEILLALSQAGKSALFLILAVALAIAALVWVVIISYRQLLLAYPHGGGAYTVAKENLGISPGLLAAAALLVDYVLTVAVSLSAGMAAVYSAWPELHINRVEITLLILLIMMLINLRGVRESGWVFGLPTYFFIGSVLLVIGTGFWRFFTGAPFPPAPPALPITHPLDWFLILKAFSSGATTLTGIEAISNAVPIFRPPEHQNARKSLLWLGIFLTAMLLGVAYLAQHLGLVPLPNETLLSQVGRWATGTGPLYYLLQLSTFLVLFLAANTSFNAFPQLASLIAKDGYLARQLKNLGDRLVYSNGIFVLSLFAGILIYIFKADTNSLIPLYAIGVFTAFTLSQWGIARYYLRQRQGGWRFRAAFGFLGGTLTGLVAVIFAVTKFIEGAWIVLIVIPLIMWLFYSIHTHYSSVTRQLSLEGVRNIPIPTHMIAVVPLSAVHRGTMQALAYAKSISSEVHAVYVEINPEESEKLRKMLERWAPGVELHILPSPYRGFLQVLEEYLTSLQKQRPEAALTVVVPEFVPARFWQQLLHNQSALLLKVRLYGRKGIVVVNVPFHLNE
ncbi:APC family permease [Candidatus Acetothermia bacterium]|nr:APC family permease [Candidatus Acetothermia bacterium]